MKSETLRRPDNPGIKIILVLVGITLLGLVYIFQRFNLAGIVGHYSPNINFVINRTIRLILNDLACFLIVLALFRERKYLEIAFLVFLVELLVILPAYLAVKLTLEGDSEISSPLLSQIHRLIVNPMLMILLIMGFFYQKYSRRVK